MRLQYCAHSVRKHSVNFFSERSNQVKYRFVATATPSPNEFQELLAYSHFLGVMDIGQARTRFFKRNSEKSDDLTLHKHKEKEFWLWVASWAMFLQKPSDLGYSTRGTTFRRCVSFITKYRSTIQSCSRSTRPRHSAVQGMLRRLSRGCS
jgi:hypothetical protein